MSRADLALFSHLVLRPDAELDLARLALIIAEQSYPGLDITHYIGVLDRLGDEARKRVASVPEAEGEQTAERVERLLRFLFDDVGFAGNRADYYDPRNSFLNEVLDRRTGIPITLAVVVIEVARRAGIAAVGVSFPGHFLVAVPTSQEPLYVDAFAGRVLDAEGLRELHAQTMGPRRDPEPRLLHPVGKAQIMVRMLNNLRAIYQERGDRFRLRAVLERLQILTPSDGEIERALLRLGGELPDDEDDDSNLN